MVFAARIMDETLQKIQKRVEPESKRLLWLMRWKMQQMG